MSICTLNVYSDLRALFGSVDPNNNHEDSGPFQCGDQVLRHFDDNVVYPTKVQVCGSNSTDSGFIPLSNNQKLTKKITSSSSLRKDRVLRPKASKAPNKSNSTDHYHDQPFKCTSEVHPSHDSEKCSQSITDDGEPCFYCFESDREKGDDIGFCVNLEGARMRMQMGYRDFLSCEESS